jgi:hypothetical protein
MGMHLMGMHLAGVHLIGMHLIGCASHRRASYRRILYVASYLSANRDNSRKVLQTSQLLARLARLAGLGSENFSMVLSAVKIMGERA